tara:strand:+ start:3871 stop:4959 length:1089 start_codon:yes stop_codon:yes gene_type:complete
MKICLIGNGLTNLILAKKLIKKKIKIDLFYEQEEKPLNFNIRTIGISNDNFNFILKDIGKIKKISWPINQIKIFNELNTNEEFIDFKYLKVPRFFVIKYKEILSLFEKSLKKEKNFRKFLIKKKNNLFSQLKTKQYNLIINSDPNNELSRKYFFQKISKNYYSNAYVAIINHNNIKNNVASQIFTKYGPIAFLPISNKQTSIVFSLSHKKNKNEIISLIKKYNTFYKIKFFSDIQNFKLNFSISRKYFYKNILCFGENLHKIHPVAGQGFNMILRDIKTLLCLIDEKNSLGLPIDASVLNQFKEKRKHLNFIFAKGVDLIYELFRFDSNLGNIYSRDLIKFFSNKKYINKIASKFADKGLSI